MDDQTRSIIRNVKGPGMLANPDPQDGRVCGGGTDLPCAFPQFARTTSCACSSPNAKPDVCDKQQWGSGCWLYEDAGWIEEREGSGRRFSGVEALGYCLLTDGLSSRTTGRLPGRKISRLILITYGSGIRKNIHRSWASTVCLARRCSWCLRRRGSEWRNLGLHARDISWRHARQVPSPWTLGAVLA